MSLLTIAEANLALSIESTALFGQSITLTDPAGLAVAMVGSSNDIGAMIDPDTQQFVSGRSASMALRISSIYAAGFTVLPVGVAERSSKPWRVTYTAKDSKSYEFAVRQTMPDRTAGVIVLALELYKP